MTIEFKTREPMRSEGENLCACGGVTVVVFEAHADSLLWAQPLCPQCLDGLYETATNDETWDPEPGSAYCLDAHGNPVCFETWLCAVEHDCCGIGHPDCERCDRRVPEYSQGPPCPQCAKCDSNNTFYLPGGSDATKALYYCSGCGHEWAEVRHTCARKAGLWKS